MIDRRSLVQFSLAAASLSMLAPSVASAMPGGPRPLVLLLGDSAHSEAFAQGVCGVLAGGEFRIEQLANPEYAAEGMTGQLRKLYSSRLIFIGDDRDHVLFDLAIGQLNARVLCSGHHRDGEWTPPSGVKR